MVGNLGNGPIMLNVLPLTSVQAKKVYMRKADGTAMIRSARECLQLLVLFRKERRETSFEATLENEIIL